MTLPGGTTIRDIPVGLSARFSKTIGESDVYLFAGITGDFDPGHVDEVYASTTFFGRRTVQGSLLVGFMSTTSTTVLSGFEGTAVSLGYDRIRFIKPVFIGDTVTVDYEVVEVDVDRGRTIARVEVHNQLHELVAVATHIQKVIE